MAKHHFTRHVARFSWWEFTLTFFIFGLLAAVPGLTYGNNARFLPTAYTWWYLLYCLIIATAFSALTAWQRYRTFEKPLRALSDAAERVADGDLSVYLQPVHRPENYNYLDAMFANFNTMVAELGSIETLRGDFVANVSHEFKRPLAVIRSYSEALQTTQLDADTQARYLATINTAATELATLVTNVLRLNKLETQATRPQKQPFDLTEQLTQVIFAHDQQLEDKQIELNVNIPDQLPVIGDAELLKVVWNNLLANAIKFTPEHGTITLTAATSATGASVSIRDTGAGMYPATQAHIFQKFYQGDTSHAAQGNGLGLAMLAQILKLTGGRIQVDSHHNQGSTFTVTLHN